MNAKMDSGPLSYQIKTDVSNTAAKFIISKPCFLTKTSTTLCSRDCSH